MKYLSIVLAVIAVAALGIKVAFVMSSLGDEIEELRAENASLHEQLKLASVQQTQIESLERELAGLLEQHSAASAVPSPSPATPEALPTSLDASEAAAAAPADADAKSAFGGMMKMLQGEEGKKMREASARSMVDMQYAPLLRDLALPPDADAQVRDLLAGHALAQLEDGMHVLEGENALSGKGMRERHDQARATLRTQLAHVFTPDELAQWDDYEANLERHMLEQSLDMQLGMTAMDDDTRLVVRDTLVEEILAGQEAMAASDDAVDVHDHVALQEAAFARARDALATALPADQYEQADRFISRQEEMLRLSMEMMQGIVESSPAASAP